VKRRLIYLKLKHPGEAQDVRSQTSVFWPRADPQRRHTLNLLAIL